MTTHWKDIPGDSKEKYALYLCSREWAEKKRPVKIRAGGICERCKRKPIDAVHHLTYIRKYDELPEDLQGLCAECHEFEHGLEFDPSLESAPTVLRDALVNVFPKIDSRLDAQFISGLSTGFRELDNQTNGLQPAEFVILAARPSMGKTALALNMAEAIADRSQRHVVIFSLEQTTDELAERLLCIRGRLDMHKLRRGDLDEDDRDKLLRVSNELSELPIFIDDRSLRTMSQIEAISKVLKREHDLHIVIIDYLQLIEPEDKRAPREQQIAQIARRLKFLAKELNVPVVALSQLNRGIEMREDKRPKLSDLRESGALEQDADIVIFLHRPEMYDPYDHPCEAEVIVAKHRNGPTGIVRLGFDKRSMQFEEYVMPPLETPLFSADGF